MALELPRRDFLRGLLSFAAPAIVHSANIMPIKAALVAIDDLGVSLFNTAHPVSEGWVPITNEINPESLVTVEFEAPTLERIRDILLPGLRLSVQLYKKFPPLTWEQLFNVES